MFLQRQLRGLLGPYKHKEKKETLVIYIFYICKIIFFFSYLGFSLDSAPGYWWTAVWIACGLGTIVIAVLILHFIEEVIS